MNGKAKTRLEPSSYGDDRLGAVGSAAEKMGVQRTRGDKAKQGRAMRWQMGKA